MREDAPSRAGTHAGGKSHKPAPMQIRGSADRLLSPDQSVGDVVWLNVTVEGGGSGRHRYRVEGASIPEVVVLNHWPKQDCCGCHAGLSGGLNIHLG